jgi:O-antigen ligase
MGHQGNIHNSWLTIWLDTGLIGLILFCVGWLVNFVRAARFTPLVWAVFFGILLSASVESWMVASLNPFTIQLVIILTLLSDERFYEMPEEEDDEDEEESNVDDQELAE